MARLCSIHGCFRVHYGLGYCQKHYLRNYRNGDPNKVFPREGKISLLTLKERIELKFKKENFKKCWVWFGATRNGYGCIGFKGKHYTVTRALWEIENGPIPKNMHLCHKCDNASCVNLNHLFLGTPKDNMKDMVNKNRSAKGENHSQSKLTEASVRKIKQLLSNGKRPGEIAIKFGVGREAISKIKNGQRWEYVK